MIMKKHINGFTLLEVLLTVAVLGVLLMYLLTAYHHLQYAYMHRGHHAQAAYLIQQQLFDARYTQTQKRKTVSKEKNVTYTVVQRPWKVKPYRKVDIYLEWPDLRTPQSMSLATMIYHEKK